MFNHKHPHNVRPGLVSWGRSIWTVTRAFFTVAIVIAFFVGLIWCRVDGCEGDVEEARRIVEGAGYTKIEIGGSRNWRCGRDDSSSNTFTAIGPSGRYVEGTVCCSIGGCVKGCTLRFE